MAYWLAIPVAEKDRLPGVVMSAGITLWSRLPGSGIFPHFSGMRTGFVAEWRETVPQPA
jgi:hypothetical protein